jgi:hypothetical protein
LFPATGVKRKFRRNNTVYIRLAGDNLTPCPSPARIIDKKPQILMAGEGSSGERGLRPLSNSFPLSNKIKIEH